MLSLFFLGKRTENLPSNIHRIYHFQKLKICERAGPAQGSKSPKLGKEGFGVEKAPSPTNPEKGNLSQKIPFFRCFLSRDIKI